MRTTILLLLLTGCSAPQVGWPTSKYVKYQRIDMQRFPNGDVQQVVVTVYGPDQETVKHLREF